MYYSRLGLTHHHRFSGCLDALPAWTRITCLDLSHRITIAESMDDHSCASRIPVPIYWHLIFSGIYRHSLSCLLWVLVFGNPRLSRDSVFCESARLCAALRRIGFVASQAAHQAHRADQPRCFELLIGPFVSSVDHFRPCATLVRVALCQG